MCANLNGSHLERYGAGALTKCLYQFDEPVSPHLAAKQKIVSHARQIAGQHS